MDPDTEVQSILRQGDDDDEEEEEEEKKKRWKRPPSSYGSMRSDSDAMEEDDERNDEEVAEACQSPLPLVPPGSAAPKDTGLQLIRSESPETVYTITTLQSKPPGALVIDTRCSDPGDCPEDEDDMDEVLVTHSPEPPEPIEPDDAMQTDEFGQPGTPHPEQGLPHVFRSIQTVLTGLTRDDLVRFKMSFYQWEQSITLQQVMEGDLLDFVDKIMEILGAERSLIHTINTLEKVKLKEAAVELQNLCNRAMVRFKLNQCWCRKYQIVREGVVRAGKQDLLDNIYVEPQISTCGYGGVYPSHEFRARPPTPVQVPTADTFIRLNNLFRQQRADGTPVRTVLTTGIPGIGLSISVGRFCLDWAEMRANKDLQFVIKISFQSFWFLRKNTTSHFSEKMSIMEVIEYYYPECKGMTYLEEEDCKFLIILSSLDCYQAPLDWENAPVITDNYTQAHPDVLIVNIIRGTVLRGARIWILGRRGAVSQIPSQYIDVVTEIQGFSDEMKDEYLEKRFEDDLSRKIKAHYKRLPTLRSLARHPFVCWMVATVFERCFRYLGYGEHPPRLTPFYVSILTVQTNRRLQFYFGKVESELNWSSDDKQQLIKMGKMALRMLERNTSVFFEEDLKEFGLKLKEVTVFSGLCTELVPAAPNGRRTFCFIHFTFQEFMAALYVFTAFRCESKNVLEPGGLHVPKIFTSKDQTRPAAALVQSALERTLGSPPGHYDMFLRFLCGMLSPDCHHTLLSGYLYSRKSPKVSGLDEVQRLLEKTIQAAQGSDGDRVENLKECIREMTQEDE